MKIIKLVKKTISTEEKEVYDITVPNNHTYLLANGIMSHNTAVSLQLAINMAKWGAKVCTVSLEMDEQEIMTRRLSNISGVSMSKLINPKTLSENEKEKIKKSYEDYKKLLKKKGGLESHFIPENDITMEELLYSLKPHDYNVIIIDYIGLLKGVDGDDQWRQLSNAARFAKVFAKTNKVQMILCAQLSDEGVIRYSRGIKEHANNMFAWNRTETSKETHILDIDQQKARNQRAFRFQLFENFDTMTIRDVSESEMQNAIEEEEANAPKKRGRRVNTVVEDFDLNP